MVIFHTKGHRLSAYAAPDGYSMAMYFYLSSATPNTSAKKVKALICVAGSPASIVPC